MLRHLPYFPKAALAGTHKKSFSLLKKGKKMLCYFKVWIFTENLKYFEDKDKMKFFEQIAASANANRSMVCVGLDPDMRKLPACVKDSPTAFFDFNKAIVDATKDYVCCYKPQAAYYAGEDRDTELAMTIDYIHANAPGIPVILDVKRGDIGSTAEQYAPEFLLQFGLVGSAYAKYTLGVENPRVGLLNIGTEDSKGTALQKAAYALLTDAGEKGLINFVGNVEARSVPLGEVDVVVCDGFSGNVMIKTIEGTAMFMGSLLKRMFKKNLGSKIGYLLCKSGVSDMMKLMDSREIGGTQFLGIKKPVIKAHGNSDRLAFRNAVNQAMIAAKSNFTQQLEESLAAMKERAAE